jgi:predicted TIM-barrel fold metal-dependent hydrolase
MSSIPDAIEEVEFAKDHGAVGVFKRGIEWDRPIHDPYFHPVFQAASDADLPICIHATLPWFALDPHFSRLDNPYPHGTNGITVIQAFQALVKSGMPAMFPTLRFGFIEAGSSWLPTVFEMTRTKKSKQQLEEWRFFVTCEPDEDIPYLINQFGDDHLMVGTDYTHSDRSSVRNKHQRIADRSDLDDKSTIKITEENGRRFYGL